MEGNKLQELRELIEFLKANEIAEFDMEREDLKVGSSLRLNMLRLLELIWRT